MFSKPTIRNMLAWVNVIFAYSLTSGVKFPLITNVSLSLLFNYLLFILFCCYWLFFWKVIFFQYTIFLVVKFKIQLYKNLKPHWSPTTEELFFKIYAMELINSFFQDFWQLKLILYHITFVCVCVCWIQTSVKVKNNY